MAKKPKKPRKSTALITAADAPPDATRLFADIRGLIEAGKAAVAQTVNSALVLLYWNIGDRIRREILGEKRALYGEEIVAALSRQLTAEYGKGFSRFALTRMMQLAEVFPDHRIVAALSQQLGWSHFVEIIPLKQPLQREFYAEMCRIERWTVRTLRDKIQGMLFERTALSRKPAELAAKELENLRAEDQMTPDLVFRDPYLLDFLKLHDSYGEADLEAAIIRELESFILELGSDLAFLARQKRMTIDGKDFHLDLLFFHRRLVRLVAIELKIGAFTAGDKGQMELYLRWLERYEMRPGEGTPIGLILCSEKSPQQVELLRLEDSGIHVAEYLKELPPRELLEKKLLEAIRLARGRLRPGPSV